MGFISNVNSGRFKWLDDNVIRPDLHRLTSWMVAGTNCDIACQGATGVKFINFQGEH